MTWHGGPVGVGRYLGRFGAMCKVCIVEDYPTARFADDDEGDGPVVEPAQEPHGECVMCKQ